MATKLDFKASTWEKAKPKDVKGDKMTSALKAVEKALAGEKQGDAASLKKCLEAIQDTSGAAADAIKKELDAKQHKDLVSALKKLQSDCEAEVKRLEKALEAADEGDEDEDENVTMDELLNVDQYDTLFKKAKNADNADSGPGFVYSFHMNDGAESKLSFFMPAQVNANYARIRRQLPKLDKAFKKKNIVSGRAYRDDKLLVLEVVDGGMPEVPGLEKKIKVWARKNKKDITPMKRLSLRIPGSAAIECDMDDDEDLTGEGQAQATGTTTPEQGAQRTTSAPPTGAPSQAPPQTAAPEQTQANGQPETAEQAEARHKEFRKARQAWQATKEKAIQDLEAVKDGIRDYYLDDPEQFKVATSKLGQLDAIMDNLSDSLRDILDKYVSTPKSRQAELTQLANQARTTVEGFLQYAQNDRLLNAVDQKEFADVTVKAPIEKALRDLVKTLG